MTNEVKVVAGDGGSSGGDAPLPQNNENNNGIVSNPIPGGSLNGNQNQIIVDAYRMPKLPDFVRTDPGLWFAQVEFMFEVGRVTGQRTRAATVVSKLDFEVVQSIADLITSREPIPNLYDEIKNRIINNFSISPEN